MDDAGTRPDEVGDAALVSDALVDKLADERTLRGRLRRWELWLLVDASRWGVVAALTVVTFLATVAVGALGPYTARQFLLEGTPLANSYVGIVQGLFTAIVISCRSIS